MPGESDFLVDAPSSKFRNPHNNSRFLKHLFYETTPADKKNVIYTLKDIDHKGYPSLYRLYLELGDLTEYEFANKYLDGWEHWCMLCECNWFKPYVARWRQELDLKIKAQMLKGIRLEATKGGRESLQAMKYLMERGWEPKGKRPPMDKKAVEAEAEKLTQEKEDLHEAAERLGITVVK